MTTHMRDAIAVHHDRDAEGIMLAHECAGGGMAAGEVDGALVVSAPVEHAGEALAGGLAALTRVPWSQWGLTTRVQVRAPVPAARGPRPGAHPPFTCRHTPNGKRKHAHTSSMKPPQESQLTHPWLVQVRQVVDTAAGDGFTAPVAGERYTLNPKA